MNAQPIIVEKTFNANAGKVWSAITSDMEMKKWYFDIPGFKPEVGFEFQFFGGTEEKQYLHLCKVTEVITGKKITYSWRYDGYSGNSFVTIELFPEVNRTRLQLTHRGLETFGTDNPDLARENFVEGWNQLINTSLVEYLEKVLPKKH